ncbi:MAG: TolC family protein [Verrucomicrobia bacterium]|nr:TolC family protein [Verrucomicrobiota bacterium]
MSFSRPLRALRPWSLVLGAWSFRRTLLAAALLAVGTAAPAAPLTLDDAIRLALQKNQALKVSAFTPQIARANVLAAYGAFDPSLNLTRTRSETTGPGVAAFTTRTAITDDYRLSLDGLAPWGLTYSLRGTSENVHGSAYAFSANYSSFGGIFLTQPLLRGFGFGSTLAGLRIAKADRGISDQQHRQNVIDTVTGVVLTYNALQLARENFRIATLSRDLAAQLVDQNEKRNRIGSLSDADVVQARARVATREESLVIAARTTRDVENQLRQLIGESTFAINPTGLELEPLGPAAPVTVDLAADLKTALDQRPDYQSARLGVTRRRVSSSLAQNQLMPRLDLVGSYGYSGTGYNFSASREQVLDRDYRAYSAGLVVSIPLTFTEGRGRARAAKLSLRQSEADLVRLESDIAIDVAAAAGQIQTTRDRVAATRTAFELAKQALDSEEKRFKAGTSRTLDVLQLQEQLAAVESSQVRALADERRAVANYERELGITLARRGLKVE